MPSRYIQLEFDLQWYDSAYLLNIDSEIRNNALNVLAASISQMKLHGDFYRTTSQQNKDFPLSGMLETPGSQLSMVFEVSSTNRYY